MECGEDYGKPADAIANNASTEPHSLECGEVTRLVHSLFLLNSFNGAALVGVRREQGQVLNVMLYIGASTEPHSLECGEIFES